MPEVMPFRVLGAFALSTLWIGVHGYSSCLHGRQATPCPESSELYNPICLAANHLCVGVQDRSVVIARFRGGNMDAVQDDQKHSLAAVFDGHKRAEAAQIASEMLPPLLAKCAQACSKRAQCRSGRSHRNSLFLISPAAQAVLQVAEEVTAACGACKRLYPVASRAY